jgi:5-carboxymethyl-2-hydroxymuconate isomerase
MQALHSAAAETGVVQGKDLKIRAQSYSDYMVAGGQESFFHLTLFMHAGRTPEQKRQLSSALLGVLAGLLPGIVSLSVDIRDMDRLAYSRRLLPS